jgi:hypothetical protein
MLWEAGQERGNRERRSRMAELYATGRDAALEVGVVTGQLKPKGPWHQPPYIDSDPAQRASRARHGLAQLIADFPGNLSPGKEFVS